MNGYSPNQLFFGENPNFPNVCDDQLPALENKTSSQVNDDNLNTLNYARQNFINSESPSRLKQVLKNQTHTFSIVMCNTGDKVFYKRKANLSWRRPEYLLGEMETGASKTWFHLWKGSSMESSVKE